MAIQTLYVPFQGLKSALATLPSTGKQGVMAFTTDTKEFYFDSGVGSGIGVAWILFGGGTAGPVINVNGLTGHVLIVGGSGISVSVVAGSIVVTNTGSAAPMPVPNAVPIDSGDHIHFTLPSVPDPSIAPMLWKNGGLLFPGAGNDYTILADAITLAAPLDVVVVPPDTLAALYWV